MSRWSTHHAVIDEGDAADLRARLEHAGFRPYWIADRGRYHLNDDHREPDLVARLAALAAQALALPALEPAAASFTRHVAGDHAMIKDDGLRLPALGPHVEVTLDLSAGRSDDGQVVWQDPRDVFVLSQVPGTAIVVDRRQPIVRWERYLPARVGETVIHRLRLVLTTP